MGSTFFSLHYHIVFSTKERRPFIKNTWQPDLHSYLGGIINGMKGVAETVGGVRITFTSWLVSGRCIASQMFFAT